MPNPFTNDRPGRHWYEGFLRRHPQLKRRICENVSLSRAMVSENKVRKWFSDVQAYLEKKQLLHIDSSRIFNTDETAVLLNPKGGAVLAEKGLKNVYNVVNNNEKENLTVLVTGNAAGQLAPTMVMFNYKRVPAAIYATMPQDFHAGVSDKGWMTASVFYEYIANKFLPWIVKNKIQLPVILFLDGHVSHLTQPLSEFCHENQIVLVALPPNTTHFMQPMDVSFFSPLKAHWKKAVNQYRVEKEVLSVSKDNVCPLLQKVFVGMDLFKCLSNGFKACGLHPFTPDAVDFSKVFLRTENNEQQVDIQDTSMSNPMSLVQGLEKHIDPAKLEIFRGYSITDEWTGSEEDKNLFYTWRMIVNNPRAPNHCIAESSIQKNNMPAQLISNSVAVLSKNLVDNADENIVLANSSLAIDQNIDPLTMKEYVGSDILSEIAEHDKENSPSQDEHLRTPFAEVIFNDNYSVEDMNLTFCIDDDGNVRLDDSLQLSKTHNQDASNDEVQKRNGNETINKANIDTESRVLQDTQNLGPNNSKISETISNKAIIQAENRVFKEIQNFGQSNLKADSKVPIQFQKFIFWPKESTAKNIKREPKTKLPSVLSSEEGLKWYANEDEKKRKVEEEKELRKKIRIEKKMIKQEQIEKKKKEKSKPRKQNLKSK